MHSKDKLADALRAVGLTEMADRAANGWYHDYLSPLDTPAITLADDLAVAAKYDSPHRAAIIALRARHINGEFDATLMKRVTIGPSRRKVRRRSES